MSEKANLCRECKQYIPGWLRYTNSVCALGHKPRLYRPSLEYKRRCKDFEEKA